METSCKNLVKENHDWKSDLNGNNQQMSGRCVAGKGDNNNAMEEDGQDEPLSIIELPDSILLHILSYLPFSSIGSVAQVCQRLWQVSMDDLLWREVFLRHYKLASNTKLPAKADSWRSEFKRLYYHTPCLLSEERKEHRDEVLHVSFSHDGTMFATCSKDGFFKVWECGHQCRLLFEKDMMSSFSWKFTQFSQFNETDTCLLVSGVYFGCLSTSGEIAVFNLQDDFNMQCRVTNKPYDVFGTWYDNDHLLSGTLYWTGDFNSVSAVWLSKASQEIESEMESVSMVLYRFENRNSSSIRLLHVAEFYYGDRNGKIVGRQPMSHFTLIVSLDSCINENLVVTVERDDDESDDSDRHFALEACSSPCRLPALETGETSGAASALSGAMMAVDESDNRSPPRGILTGRSVDATALSSDDNNMTAVCEMRLLDKILRKSIAENEFDLENEDDTDVEETGGDNYGVTRERSPDDDGDESCKCGDNTPADSLGSEEVCRLGSAECGSCVKESLRVNSSGEKRVIESVIDGEGVNVNVISYGEPGPSLPSTSTSKSNRKFRKDWSSGDCGDYLSSMQADYDGSKSSDIGERYDDEVLASNKSVWSDSYNSGDSSVGGEWEKKGINSGSNSNSSRGLSGGLDALLINNMDQCEPGSSDCTYSDLSKGFLPQGVASSFVMSGKSDADRDVKEVNCDVVDSLRGGKAGEHSTRKQLCDDGGGGCDLSGTEKNSNNGNSSNLFSHNAERCLNEIDGIYSPPKQADRIAASPQRVGSSSERPLDSGNDGDGDDKMSCSHDGVEPMKDFLTVDGGIDATEKLDSDTGLLSLPRTNNKMMDNASTQTDESSLSGSIQSSVAHMSHSSSASRDMGPRRVTDKLLIYTWGSETYIPHKIGIKRIKRSDFCKGEVKARCPSMLLPDVMENLHNVSGEDRRDVPDVSIDMHGHIVGLSLSPDDRYLYVNCRSWPKGYIISDPQESPPLAQEVEISTIDLKTFQFVGPVLRCHKAYTHSDECFFLNLDVSEDYVVSGAEDRKGYIWDRYYGNCLGQFEHRSVVNCMAVCPSDPEVAVSVSDDHTFKVWMSRRRLKESQNSGSQYNRLTHRNSLE